MADSSERDKHIVRLHIEALSKGKELTYREISVLIQDQFGEVDPVAIRGVVRRWRKRTFRKQLKHETPTAAIAANDDELSLAALFELARANQTVLNRIDPVITYVKKRIDTDRPIGVIFTSCAHLGSRYTFYEGFAEIFNSVLETPNLLWVSLGDDIEGFMSGFPDAAAVTDQAIANPKIQQRMLAGVLDQLAGNDKLLAGCASQHGGKWIESKVGMNPIKDLYLQRKIPWFDGKGLFTLEVGEQTYQIALAHEFPGNSIYNANHAQRRAGLFEFPNEDVIVMGDKHRYSVQEISLPPYEFDAGMRPTYFQFLVQVGTAKIGLDRYSIRGWSRGVLEWPILIFHPKRHEITYTRSVPIARMLLEQEW